MLRSTPTLSSCQYGDQHQTTALGGRVKADWFAALMLFAVAAILRSLPLWEVARFDELYHVLAAQGWLATNEFRIGEGIYDRGSLYTLLTALSFKLFGVSLEAARLPSIVAGSVLVPLVFLWTSRVAGRVAAWCAAGLLCIDPSAMAMSHFARFYALQGLLLWLAAVGTYRLFVMPKSLLSFIGIAAGSAACFLIALDLQVTSLTGLAGVIVWVGIVFVLPWLWSRPVAERIWWLGIGATVAAIGCFALIYSGVASRLVDIYTNAALWTSGQKGIFWFYHWLFVNNYPLLWSLAPVAMVVALVARPRPSAFCISIFLTSVLILSFGGSKGIRFVYFAIPFYFVIFGIAVQAVLPLLLNYLRVLFVAASSGIHVRVPARVLATLPWAVLATVVVATPPVSVTLAMISGAVTATMAIGARWPEAAGKLEPWLENKPIILAGSELHALYYLGHYDITLSKSRLGELEDQSEFSRDHRTGLPVVSTTASLDRILNCVPEGLIVSPESHWRQPYDISEGLANLIERRTVRLDAPRGIRAYYWKHDARESGVSCEPLSGLLRREKPAPSRTGDTSPHDGSTARSD